MSVNTSDCLFKNSLRVWREEDGRRYKNKQRNFRVQPQEPELEVSLAKDPANFRDHSFRHFLSQVCGAFKSFRT